MVIPLFHVDAFTSQPFAGNPAAVCPLESWLDEATLRAVAAENNLSETAYFVPCGEHHELRWFTPRCEVKLCGHATLASAFVLFNILEPARDTVQFKTRHSGMLTVCRDGNRLAMDFPALPLHSCSHPPADLFVGLGSPSSRPVLQHQDKYFVVYDSEDEIRGVEPDFSQLEKLHPAAVAITAPGSDADFVSRYFAPSYGVPEDPVTGSAHCSLALYWGERLAKKRLHARQLSSRGGEIWCEWAGDRLIITGDAVLTLRGSLLI